MTDVRGARELVARLEADLAAVEAEMAALIERHGQAVLRVAKRSNGGGAARSADVLAEERRKMEFRREALIAAVGASRQELAAAEADQRRARDRELADRLVVLVAELHQENRQVDVAMADLRSALEQRNEVVQRLLSALPAGTGANDFSNRVNSSFVLTRAAAGHGLANYVQLPFVERHHAVPLKALEFPEVDRVVERLRGDGSRASGAEAA
jgi:hypothetical protein